MSIESTRVHSSAREFFKNPQTQYYLKITAVALAALAVMSAALAASIILAMPLLTLIVPAVAVSATALFILLSIRSKPNSAKMDQAPSKQFQPDPVRVLPQWYEDVIRNARMHCIHERTEHVYNRARHLGQR